MNQAVRLPHFTSDPSTSAPLIFILPHLISSSLRGQRLLTKPEKPAAGGDPALYRVLYHNTLPFSHQLSALMSDLSPLSDQISQISSLKSTLSRSVHSLTFGSFLLSRADLSDVSKLQGLAEVERMDVMVRRARDQKRAVGLVVLLLLLLMLLLLLLLLLLRLSSLFLISLLAFFDVFSSSYFPFLLLGYISPLFSSSLRSLSTPSPHFYASTDLSQEQPPRSNPSYSPITLRHLSSHQHAINPQRRLPPLKSHQFYPILCQPTQHWQLQSAAHALQVIS